MTDEERVTAAQPERLAAGAAGASCWADRLRTFGWVALLTAAVWVWADGDPAC